MAMIKEGQLSSLATKEDLMEIQKRFPLSFFPFDSIEKLDHIFTEIQEEDNTWTAHMHFNYDLVPSNYNSKVGELIPLKTFMELTGGFRGLLFYNGVNLISDSKIQIRMNSYYSYDLYIKGLSEKPSINGIDLYQTSRRFFEYRRYPNTFNVSKSEYDRMIFIKNDAIIQPTINSITDSTVNITYTSEDTIILFFKDLVYKKKVSGFETLNSVAYLDLHSDLDSLLENHSMHIVRYKEFKLINSDVMTMDYLKTPNLEVGDTILIFGTKGRVSNLIDKFYLRDFKNTRDMIENGHSLYDYTQMVSNPKFFNNMTLTELNEVYQNLILTDATYIADKLEDLYGHRINKLTSSDMDEIEEFKPTILNQIRHWRAKEYKNDELYLLGKTITTDTCYIETELQITQYPTNYATVVNVKDNVLSPLSGYQLSINNTGKVAMRSQRKQGAEFIFSDETLTLNKWYTVKCIWESDKIQIWIDDNKVKEEMVSNTQDSVLSYYHLGAESEETRFNGEIRNPKIGIKKNRSLKYNLENIDLPFLDGVFNIGDFSEIIDGKLHCYWAKETIDSASDFRVLSMPRQPFNRQLEISDKITDIVPFNDRYNATIETQITANEESPNLKVFNFVNDRMYECDIKNAYKLDNGNIKIEIEGIRDTNKPIYIVSNNHYLSRVKIQTNTPYFNIDDYNTLSRREELLLFIQGVGLVKPLEVEKTNKNIHKSVKAGSTVSFKTYVENGNYVMLDTSYRRLGVYGVVEEAEGDGYVENGYNIVELPEWLPPFSNRYYLLFSNGKLITNAQAFTEHLIRVPRDANEIIVYCANVDFDYYFLLWKSLKQDSNYKKYFNDLIKANPSLTPYTKEKIVVVDNPDSEKEFEGFAKESIIIDKILTMRSLEDISQFTEEDKKAFSQTNNGRIILSGSRRGNARVRTK